jgi:hypothetical protein
MTMVERLYEVGSILPPMAQAELLDFAEFLCRKNRVTVPPGNMPLLGLAGGLEHSSNFAESPLAIQESLRREWD